MKKNRRTWLQEAANLKKQGFSPTEIGEKLGIARYNVTSALKRAGLNVSYYETNKNIVFDKYVSNWGETSHELLEGYLRKFNTKKFAATRHKVEFNLNFWEIRFPEKCPVLGITLDYFAKKTCEASPSIDRVNSDLGYTKDNSCVISFKANTIKNSGNALEHRAIYKYMIERQI